MKSQISRIALDICKMMGPLRFSLIEIYIGGALCGVSKVATIVF